MNPEEFRHALEPLLHYRGAYAALVAAEPVLGALEQTGGSRRDHNLEAAA